MPSEDSEWTEETLYVTVTFLSDPFTESALRNVEGSHNSFFYNHLL